MVSVGLYLLNKYDLWLWDFDDTLIDTYTYYIKSMEPENILKRTNKELTDDLPSWKYFRDLCFFLIKHNKKVGIVSFGTYKIIRAYMNRIFGFDQKIFTNKNLICLPRDKTGKPLRLYPNKNLFIGMIMDEYYVCNKKKLILFDDLMSNISAAKNVGIMAFKIRGKEDNKREYTCPSNLFNCNTLTILEHKLKEKENKNKNVLLFNECNKYESIDKFGSIGLRKNYSKELNEELGKREAEYLKVDAFLQNKKKKKNNIEVDLFFDKFEKPEDTVESVIKKEAMDKAKKYIMFKENECDETYSDCDGEPDLCDTKIEEEISVSEEYEEKEERKRCDVELFTNRNNEIPELEKHKTIFFIIIIGLLVLSVLYLIKNNKK